MSGDGTDYSKSFVTKDPIIQYCVKYSVNFEPIQQLLLDKTLKECADYKMQSAPEVLQLGHNMIQLIRANKVLDIGTFTGSSALAWALATPPDGNVLSMDVSHTRLDTIGREIIESRPEIAKKITFKLAPALDTLDALIAAGESGKWDFAFIDADKKHYPDYYERCLTLLRPGGVILIDNALWGGNVIREERNSETLAIHKTNEFAAKDQRVNNILLNFGDGSHLIFKKYD